MYLHDKFCDLHAFRKNVKPKLSMKTYVFYSHNKYEKQ